MYDDAWRRAKWQEIKTKKKKYMKTPNNAHEKLFLMFFCALFLAAKSDKKNSQYLMETLLARLSVPLKFPL